jgi:hypothetical protein
MVSTALRKARQSLTGRKSTERRQRFLDSLQRRKEKRGAGKHLSELKTLLGGTAGGSMLDVLDEGGQRITDPHDIAQHTNEFFQEWHKKHDIDHGFHSVDPDMDHLLSDYEYFRDQHMTTGIPDHLLHKIWSSLTAPRATLVSQPDKVRDFHAALDTPPTFAEFREALHHSKRQSSAGMSGVTYNLMSLWPTETVERVHGLTNLHLLSGNGAGWFLSPKKLTQTLLPTYGRSLSLKHHGSYGLASSSTKSKHFGQPQGFFVPHSMHISPTSPPKGH